MPTVGASVLAAADAAAGFVPCAAVLDALAAAAWVAANAAFVASVVLFNVASLVCAPVVFAAASASAALLAAASAVLAVVVVVGSSLSPSLFFASPSIVPEASVLPLPDVCSDTPVSVLVPVVAPDAEPTDAACVGTAPCAPLNAARAACKASVTDFGSLPASFLP